jgi:hypothetical protein
MKSAIMHMDEFTAGWKNISDAAFLSMLKKSKPLAGEDDPAWNKESYWINGLYRFLAFSRAAAARKLKAAIPLLLDRATEFDQDNLLEGLRHDFEEIMKPDWAALADICLKAAKSRRVGTRKWSLYQLTVLDDARAFPVFKASLKDKNPDISGLARIGLDRLAALRKAKRKS